MENASCTQILGGVMGARLQRLINRRTAKVGETTPAPHPAAKEAWLRRCIGIVIARYFINGDRSSEVFVPFENVSVSGGMADWIPWALERQELSEPEFAAFRFFDDPNATVLDIGAHWGHSVTSIWRAGCPAHVLSFEPNPWQHAALSRLKELRGQRFDFLNIGLSNQHGRLRFVIPVIEGMGIGGLGSAAIERELEWIIPDNLVHYVMTYLPQVATPVLQFTEGEFDVAPLDEVLATADVAVPVQRIMAIKLDVEGWEAEVIDGARETLRRHRPAMLVEGANRTAPVVERLAALGFRYAEFSDGRVHLSDAISGRIGGYYLHEARLDEYRRSGLLAT
jgi:FkbM family methyltransferase